MRQINTYTKCMSQKKRLRVKNKSLQTVVKLGERENARKDFFELLRRATQPPVKK